MAVVSGSQAFGLLTAVVALAGLGLRPLQAAGAADELTTIMQRLDADCGVAYVAYEKDRQRAEDVYTTTISRAADAATATLSATAKRATRSSDLGTASLTWQAVLSIDPQHAEARDYFTITNQLDDVLSSLVAAADTELPPSPVAVRGSSVLLIIGAEKPTAGEEWMVGVLRRLGAPPRVLAQSAPTEQEMQRARAIFISDSAKRSQLPPAMAQSPAGIMVLGSIGWKTLHMQGNPSLVGAKGSQDEMARVTQPGLPMVGGLNGTDNDLIDDGPVLRCLYPLRGAIALRSTLNFARPFALCWYYEKSWQLDEDTTAAGRRLGLCWLTESKLTDKGKRVVEASARWVLAKAPSKTVAPPNEGSAMFPGDLRDAKGKGDGQAVPGPAAGGGGKAGGRRGGKKG